MKLFKSILTVAMSAAIALGGAAGITDQREHVEYWVSMGDVEIIASEPIEGSGVVFVPIAEQLAFISLDDLEGDITKAEGLVSGLNIAPEFAEDYLALLTYYLLGGYRVHLGASHLAVIRPTNAAGPIIRVNITGRQVDRTLTWYYWSHNAPSVAAYNAVPTAFRLQERFGVHELSGVMLRANHELTWQQDSDNRWYIYPSPQFTGILLRQ